MALSLSSLIWNSKMTKSNILLLYIFHLGKQPTVPCCSTPYVLLQSGIEYGWIERTSFSYPLACSHLNVFHFNWFHPVLSPLFFFPNAPTFRWLRSAFDHRLLVVQRSGCCFLSTYCCQNISHRIGMMMRRRIQRHSELAVDAVAVDVPYAAFPSDPRRSKKNAL